MFNLDSFNLKGKKAIVTGAGKDTGLCYGMAEALHDCGASVVVMDVTPSVYDIAEKLGGAEKGCYGVVANLTDDESRQSGFNKALELLGGRLDILLNGAGVQFRCPAKDFPEDRFKWVIDVNLTAQFLMCQQAAAVMIPQGSGKIINMASMCSFLGSKLIPAYSASKGGIMQMTKALSNEWASCGINVNAIAPGYMETELTADLRKMEMGKEITRKIPMGRWGKAEDLKGVVVFLASSASDYLSGAIIPVDGGFLGA